MEQASRGASPGPAPGRSPKFLHCANLSDSVCTFQTALLEHRHRLSSELLLWDEREVTRPGCILVFPFLQKQDATSISSTTQSNMLFLASAFCRPLPLTNSVVTFPLCHSESELRHLWKGTTFIHRLPTEGKARSGKSLSVNVMWKQ